MQSALRWDDLRIFLAVFRERSLSVAAAILGVNPSTTGRRIAALEESLGVHLFDRSNDGAAPTAAALELAPIAERMESAALDAGAVVEGFEREPEGAVVIAAPPGIADHYIAPMIPALLERYPRLVVELDARISYVDLVRREADLAIRAMPPTAGDLVTRKLGDGISVILASPAMAAELGRLGDLADARWITWRRDLAHIPTGRWVAESVPESAIVLRTNSFTAQLEAARAGVGVCLLPEVFIERVDGVVAVSLARSLARSLPPMPVDSAWLVGLRANRAVPRIAAVWDFVIESFDP